MYSFLITDEMTDSNGVKVHDREGLKYSSWYSSSPSAETTPSSPSPPDLNDIGKKIPSVLRKVRAPMPLLLLLPGHVHILAAVFDSDPVGQRSVHAGIEWASCLEQLIACRLRNGHLHQR